MKTLKRFWWMILVIICFIGFSIWGQIKSWESADLIAKIFAVILCDLMLVLCGLLIAVLITLIIMEKEDK